MTVPGNTSAEIHVPAGADQDVTVRSPGRVDPVRREDGYAVFDAGSGTHVFEVRG